jgi:serine/threonine protein kinase
MTLVAGTRLGPYELVGAIGAGGMGEVYRARDTKLNRDVALKILPDIFAADPERLARFQREAQVLASLNHPNIGAIYGLEESNGVRALVMELVEGPTLAARIATGPIPLAEVLPIARQIADALEAAHEQGIIHRDLKPANIKVREDGTVKVLDFGLAKAMEPAAGSSPSVSQSPTFTTPAVTEAGMILGTAAYMSPEQARGKTIDKRTDVWAFACVLFEMLIGRAIFTGETISDTIAAILEREPEWGALPAETPAGIRQLMQRCLDKDPRRRLRDIGDARIEIDDVQSGSQPDGRVAQVPAGSRRRLAWASTLAAIF